MIRAQLRRTILLGLLPALVVALVYGVLFSYRGDYLGHYAAGYGGSFAAVMLILAVLPQRRFGQCAALAMVPISLAAIALGAMAEATVFRLAKFDEVDFCNQSLGAVLACLASLAVVGRQKPPGLVFWFGVLIGLGYLTAGFHYALG